MKQITLTLTIAFLCTLNTFAQIKATTDDGREVMLYHDYTWSYLSENEINQEGIPNKNLEAFVKKETSNLLVDSKNKNFGVWINPKKWEHLPSTINTSAEWEFSYKDSDIFAIMISELTEIPLLTLRDFAIVNAKKVANKFKINHQEIRNVNGIDVAVLQMEGEVQKLKISYLGYYYSNSKGNVQLLSYCSKNLFNTNKEEMEEFLNGLVALD